MLLLVKFQALLKLTLLHGCFSHFLNFTDVNKSRKASHIHNVECFTFFIEVNFAVTPTVIKLPLAKEIKKIPVLLK